MIQFSARARPPKRMQIERRKPVKWTLSRRSRVRRLPSCWGSRAGQQRQRQRQWQRTRRVGGGSRVLCFASLAPYLVLTLAVRLCSRRRRRRRLRAPLSARALTSELSELEAGSQTRPSDTATGRRRPTDHRSDRRSNKRLSRHSYFASEPAQLLRAAVGCDAERERARASERKREEARSASRASSGGSRRARSRRLEPGVVANSTRPGLNSIGSCVCKLQFASRSTCTLEGRRIQQLSAVRPLRSVSKHTDADAREGSKGGCKQVKATSASGQQQQRRPAHVRAQHMRGGGKQHVGRLRGGKQLRTVDRQRWPLASPTPAVGLLPLLLLLHAQRRRTNTGAKAGLRAARAGR